MAQNKESYNKRPGRYSKIKIVIEKTDISLTFYKLTSFLFEQAIALQEL